MSDDDDTIPRDQAMRTARALERAIHWMAWAAAGLIVLVIVAQGMLR